MKRYLKIIRILFYFAVLASFGLADKARAEVSGLSVDTSLIMLRMQAGSDLQFSFNIKNQTDSSQRISLEEKDIQIGDENEVVFLDAQDGPKNWVTFEQNNFILTAGQTQAIKANLKIPKDQKADIQMMTMVLFQSADDLLSNEGPKVNGSIGVYTLLSGGEAQNASGGIENFNYSKFVDKADDVSILYLNSGDVQFVPQGKISVLNCFTKEKSEVFFENHFVFPQKKFTYVKKLSEFSPFWVYQMKVSFSDGDGQISEKTGYAVGKFFPIIFFVTFLVSWYLFMALMRLRRKNKE